MTSEQSRREEPERVMWLIGVILGGSLVGGEQAGGRTRAVTPVEGPSTLRRLGLTIEQTSIGSASWAEGIAPSTDAATRRRPRRAPSRAPTFFA